MSVITVKELDGFRGQACLVKDEETERFFVVSSVDTRDMMGSLGGLNNDTEDDDTEDDD